MKGHRTPQTLASFVLSFTLLPTMAKYMLWSHHHEESPHTADA